MLYMIESWNIRLITFFLSAVFIDINLKHPLKLNIFNENWNRVNVNNAKRSNV